MAGIGNRTKAFFNHPKIKPVREGLEGFLIGCWQGVIEVIPELLKVAVKVYLAAFAIGLAYYIFYIRK